MRPSFPLFASHRWYEYILGEPVAQHPTMWRFLAPGVFRGSASLGIPSTTFWVYGYGVFDWDYDNDRYELTRFNALPYYSGSWGAQCVVWVSDTDVRIIGNLVKDSSQDTIRHAGKISVNAAGVISWIEPATTACGNDLVNNAIYYPGWAIGYNGGAIHPYANGAFSPSPTSNCYIGKITATNSATNLGPLRSGLTSGAQHAPLCSLGASAAGNGYAVGVQNCYQDSTAGTMYVGLYNVAIATPSLVTTCSYSGRPGTWGPLHLGGQKVLVHDNHTIDYNGKVSLLTTNSATSPTSLTQSSTAFAPTLPFRSGDVEYSYPAAGGFNAQNYWVSEGLGAGLCLYSLNQNLAVGETYRYYYVPCKYTAPGTTVSIELLTHDAEGTPLPIETTWWTSALQNTHSYAFQMVGAPDNKSSLFWSVGSNPTTQTVLQL